MKKKTKNISMNPDKKGQTIFFPTTSTSIFLFVSFTFFFQLSFYSPFFLQVKEGMRGDAEIAGMCRGWERIGMVIRAPEAGIQQEGSFDECVCYGGCHNFACFSFVSPGCNE